MYITVISLHFTFVYTLFRVSRTVCLGAPSMQRALFVRSSPTSLAGHSPLARRPSRSSGSLRGLAGVRRETVTPSLRLASLCLSILHFSVRCGHIYMYMLFD